MSSGRCEPARTRNAFSPEGASDYRLIPNRALYEFGCKSLPLRKQKCRWQPRPPSPKGGQFVLHAKALHGNPFDGHTLGPVIAELEALTGIETRRIDVDKSLPLRRRGLSRP